eukprot:4811614-Amphidinium_carterae.1
MKLKPQGGQRSHNAQGSAVLGLEPKWLRTVLGKRPKAKNGKKGKEGPRCKRTAAKNTTPQIQEKTN